MIRPYGAIAGIAVAMKAVLMTLENFALLSSRGRFSLAAIIFALVVAAVWAVLLFLQTAPPMRGACSRSRWSNPQR